MDQNKMQKLAGVISESRIREPYKQPCFGKLTLEVKRANTRPYSAFSIRSNARWFPQTTSDGRKVEVSNTMFDPRELGVLCAQLSGIEPENGYFRIPVKTETRTVVEGATTSAVSSSTADGLTPAQIYDTYAQGVVEVAEDLDRHRDYDLFGDAYPDPGQDRRDHGDEPDQVDEHHHRVGDLVARPLDAVEQPCREVWLSGGVGGHAP